VRARNAKVCATWEERIRAGGPIRRPDRYATAGPGRAHTPYRDPAVVPATFHPGRTHWQPCAVNCPACGVPLEVIRATGEDPDPDATAERRRAAWADIEAAALLREAGNAEGPP
jgi:hypothetical protein